MILTNEQIGEVCGIFAGDGNIDKTKPFIRIYIALDEEKYARYVSNLLGIFVGRKIKIRKDKKNVFIVYVYSKKLRELLIKYLTWNNDKGRTIRLRMINHNKKFIRGFLRGLFDTDGSAKKGFANFSTVSNKLKDQISEFLRTFEYKFNVFSWKCKKGYAFKIHLNTLETKKFVEFLQPKNEKRYEFGTKLIDHNEENKIIELRKLGFNVYDIAKKVKRNHASVSKILLKNNLSKKRTSNEEVYKIKNLRKEGYSVKKIAKMTNKSYYIIWWTLKKRLIS